MPAASAPLSRRRSRLRQLARLAGRGAGRAAAPAGDGLEAACLRRAEIIVSPQYSSSAAANPTTQL